MKKPEEIIALYPGLTQLKLSDIEQASLEQAMKEYAKQWIDEAADVAMYNAEAGLPVGNVVLDLKNEIAAQ